MNVNLIIIQVTFIKNRYTCCIIRLRVWFRVSILHILLLLL